MKINLFNLKLKTNNYVSIFYTMLSNYDIEEIEHFYKIDIVVVMKDELIKIKPISGNYIINLESSKDGNGTHWMALIIEDFDCIYFDSYGYLPPKEIITYCKRICQYSISLSDT